MEQNLSRRAFLGLGASAAVAAGAMGLAGCSQPQSATPAPQTGTDATPAAGGAPADFVPNFMTAPAVPESVAETKDCDVLVIGLGLSGCAAAKAAAEEGAKVIAVEKSPELAAVSMAGDFGVVGSQIQKDLGIKWAGKDVIVNQLMKDMCYRPTPDFLGYWYDHSGEDFDWFVEGADFEVLKSTAANQETDKPCYIRPKCSPALEGYDYTTEYYPYFHGTITTNPNMQWTLEAAVAAAEAKGAEMIYGTWGEQLITDDSGRVVGAYVHDADDVYTQINAKSVVLATGDWGNNQDMRDYYIPWANEFMSFYTTMDAAGNVGNTGDGHLMGLWAGAHMELGPHAPMTHHMGGPLGVDGYLQLNINGERFMNEDIPGQNIADQLSRVPVGPNPMSGADDLRSWQIFDAKWPTEIAKMPDGHGYVNHFVADDEVDAYATVLSGFGLGYTTKAMVEGTEGLIVADTIEDLAAQCNLPVEAVVASVNRYNELCAAGHDADFGKDPRRLFPVSEPPFYAYPFGSAGMLVLMGGLEVNKKLQPLNAEGAPIEGLYATGNVQGGRYLVEYPVTVAGISLGTALSFGRLAGMNAAGADIEAMSRA
ncbi:FAD-dependent oxidoreductase [Adlercreutzia caecimuris]|uniref:FAD-dependent oxidoreductase n=1 Tax=Adlercreutzia caecimuris TaxID=671266 RepID=UPI00272C27C7|nr:FAD-dependent oxidoreductase [Adlercreutzia caecimuris]